LSSYDDLKAALGFKAVDAFVLLSLTALLRSNFLQSLLEESLEIQVLIQGLKILAFLIRLPSRIT